MRSVIRHVLIGLTLTIAIAAVVLGIVTLHTPVSALPTPDGSSAVPAAAVTPAPDEQAARERGLSRGEERTPPPVVSSDVLKDRNRLLAEQREQAKQAAKKAAKKAAEEELQRTIKEDGYDPTEATTPREVGQQMAANLYGWTGSEWNCYDKLIMSESRWVVDATNPSSGAYGIPQSLPGDKMASEGSDWRTNPATQIKWGLKYVKQRYGTACSAWSFKQANNWY